jgi:hypothetical protein
MPSTRTLDPSTSHEAEKSVSGLAESYRIILGLLREHGPMNDEQLINAWRKYSHKYASDSGIRSRRSELVATQLVVDTGDRIKMTSGRMSIVWGIA